MEFDPIAYINEPRWQESRLGLDRIAELLERMGRPQDRLRFVHVAGTNGKGSVCAYLANVLMAAGFRTGLFTSPYLIDFEERIRVDGSSISRGDLRDVTWFVRGHAEAMAGEAGEHPTEFELMTAVAFEHFARSGCDIVVCEVGLGGRLDSTNVIEAPEACVITRIGLDHTGLLGDTPTAIAREKTGIVKSGATIVSWPQDDAGARQVVEEAAARCGCELVIPDFGSLQMIDVSDGMRLFRYAGRKWRTRLLGSYQPYNAALAIEAAFALRRRGWDIGYEALESGIERASWPARFEVVAGEPVIVVDGGHNPQGALALADSLCDVFPGQSVTFVMGVLADKGYRAMVRAVAPLAQAIVCVTPPNPRALSARELADAIRGEAPGIEAIVAATFGEAMERARQLAGPEGIVCAFGSLYSVGEIMGVTGK